MFRKCSDINSNNEYVFACRRECIKFTDFSTGFGVTLSPHRTNLSELKSTATLIRLKRLETGSDLAPQCKTVTGNTLKLATFDV